MRSETCTTQWEEDTNLEGSLTLCQFTRIVVSDSTLQFMSSPTMCSWPGFWYKTWVSFCGVGLNSSQKVAGYTYNICTNIVLCLTMSDINTIQGFQAKVRLRMTFTLTRLHSTFQYYESISTGKSLPSQYWLDSSMFCIQCLWCHQQKKKIFLFISGGQLRAMPISCTVCEVSGISLTNNSRQGILPS